jgi:AcrR family transcriptional regulator
MSASSSRQRRGQKTRQTILDAARQIIADGGLAELSMRSLAERIDYSASGLYEYFDGKEQIIAAVCGDAHARLTRKMAEVDEKLPPDDYLVHIGQAYVDFAVAEPNVFKLMFAYVAPNPPDAAMLSEASSYRLLLGAIERGIEAGVFKPRRGFGLKEMAFAAWSMVHGISMLRISMKETSPAFEAFERQALLAMGRGLKNR